MSNRIKEVLKEKNIAVQDLASKLGINRTALSRQINGNPKIETLQKIADVIGVSYLELLPEYADTQNNEVIGFIKIRGIIHEIKNIEDLKDLYTSL